MRESASFGSAIDFRHLHHYSSFNFMKRDGSPRVELNYTATIN